MIFVRSVFKTMKLPKSIWNVIKKRVIYIKNRIIITNESDNKIIIFFEDVNGIFSDISNLQTLDCRTYIYIFKIFSRYKLNDHCWKDIHVDYDKNNQWKIYNSCIRTVHLIRTSDLTKRISFMTKISMFLRIINILITNQK